MIYFDNAATTAVTEECLTIYKKYQIADFYNPSAPYHGGLVLSNEINDARKRILSALGATIDDKMVFTSSGTESDNLVLFGTKKGKNARIIVSESEHPAVYNAAMELKNRGYDVVFCEVDEAGRVLRDKFEALLNENVALVSIMHVNNETGCVNDIKDLCALTKKKCPDAIFHSDGVQAVGKINVSIRDLGVDAYTISGHKIHCMKGIAGLYLKKDVNVKPILFGGGQELGIRSSTENVGGIMAFAYAVEEACQKQVENEERIKKCRSDMVTFLAEYGCKIVNSEMQSPYILCAVMPKIRGEVMLHSLEKYSIYIGTGSACSSKKTQKKLPKILKLDQSFENGIIRLSFSRFTQLDDIENFKKPFKIEFSALLKYVI